MITDANQLTARFRAARFITSSSSLRQLPPEHSVDGDSREVAFAGRSNAGKSSALNALTGQKSLARTSKTPGRTQLINTFELMPQRYLVDLPGYGYAKVPEAVRRQWQTLLQRYLNHRQSLRGLCILMDVRHPLTPLDQQLIDWCFEANLSCYVLLTKADKLKRGPALDALRQVNKALAQRPTAPLAHNVTATAQLFSAVSGLGLDQARQHIGRWLFTD